MLTSSQCESIVRLIHKKDDVRDPKNWRPISLLNTDYKLASKVITERVKKVMSSIVHQDQTCGVVGRTIFSNLHLIRDILDMIDKTNEPAVLVTLDQEKAFDRIDHNFLMCVLSKFGFGPSFCRWVEIFYNRVFSRIIVNDKLSSQVFLDRVLGKAVLSPLSYICWFLKFCQPKFVILMRLKAFCSPEPEAFNRRFLNMLTMPPLFSNPRNLSPLF